MKESKSLLIIAGKIEKGFEFGRFKSNCEQCENIFLINQYIPDNLLNYLMYSSNLVVLPYLRGSMSAVAITAAEFSKPVLSTKFGVIEEYVRDEIDGYVVENNEQSLQRILLYLENEVSNEMLLQMGRRFKKHLNDEFNWDVIGKKLVVETYMDCITKEA
jgi:glycosyltransferase